MILINEAAVESHSLRQRLKIEAGALGGIGIEQTVGVFWVDGIYVIFACKGFESPSRRKETDDPLTTPIVLCRF